MKKFWRHLFALVVAVHTVTLAVTCPRTLPAQGI